MMVEAACECESWGDAERVGEAWVANELRKEKGQPSPLCPEYEK